MAEERKKLRSASQKSLDIAREGVQRQAFERGLTQPRTVSITEDGVKRTFRITPRAPKTASQARGKQLADSEEI